MEQKCSIIRSTSPILDVVGDEDHGTRPAHTILRTKHYAAVTCDLSDVDGLEKIIADFELESHSVLFVAEVSITYMEVEAADAVIKLASSISDARFCLLEQWMPDGVNHPFASTMLQHFHNLNSPIKSPLTYQDAQQQRNRFVRCGWPKMDVRNLWDLWGDDGFISAAERRQLDLVEPFDEWEEFALFGCHYFLLVAGSESSSMVPQPAKIPRDPAGGYYYEHMYGRYRTTKEIHRYSAVFRSSRDIVCHGGYGPKGRLDDSRLYSIDGAKDLNDRDLDKAASSLLSLPKLERMCHTATKVGDAGVLIAGGRASPWDAHKSCFWGQARVWSKAPDLPEGRFRHCAVCVSPRSDTVGVLIFGGKTGSGEILDDWVYWSPGSSEWQKLPVVGDNPPGRFAAAISIYRSEPRQGSLTGGLSKDGKVLQDLWDWTICSSEEGDLQIHCKDRTPEVIAAGSSIEDLGRFGASMVEQASIEGRDSSLYLVGGIGASDLVPQSRDILEVTSQLLFDFNSVGHTEPACQRKKGFGDPAPRPLLVGHSLEAFGDDPMKTGLVILGGGALCFSFGSFWNRGVYTIGVTEYPPRVQPWAVIPAKDSGRPVAHTSTGVGSVLGALPHGSSRDGLLATRGLANASLADISTGEPKQVDRVRITGKTQDFEALLAEARPAILESLDFGRCTTTWDMEYLKQKIGPERKVVVHWSPSASMDFLKKNFQYKTMAFGEFAEAAEAGERVYLRSLSSDKPADKATNLKDDFATISDDFSLPPELAYAAANAHSTPLRISGRVGVWLHYDVLPNVYCQVRGRRRLALFHPATAGGLAFPHGASSSSLDVFDERGGVRAELASLAPLVCDVEAGEALLIPALWAHAARPSGGEGEGASVAVNVFFRSLAGGYAAGKDVYGNRDVQAYEGGRRDIERISKSLRKLPREFGQFYLRRLVAELDEVAAAW